MRENMTSSRKAEQDKLSCPLCMEIFRDPRELPCVHTFCLACLHSYIMTANAEASSGIEGFHCPVCRAYTIAPLHGLYPYSWAENYPPNYSVRALLEDKSSVKQKSRTKTESGGKNKHRIKSKERSVVNTESDCQGCELHGTVLCRTCTERQNSKTKGESSLRSDGKHDAGNLIGSSYNDDHMTTKPHRSLSRVGRSGSSFDDEIPGSPQLDPSVLAYEFANARVINSLGPIADPPDSGDPYDNIVPKKMVLKRLCGVNLDKRRSFEKVCPPPFTYDDIMPGPVADYQSLRAVRSHSYGEVEKELSDDFREFLQMNMPQQHKDHSNTVGHLNDIKEEDEEIRPVEGSHMVTRLHEKVYVRAHNDQRCCFITGLTTLPGNRVLIADENNRNVKLYTTDGTFIQYISFHSEPFDIDKMGSNEAVVSFQNEKCLRFLHIDMNDTINVTRTIKYEKKCRGVACHRREIFVVLENEVRVVNYNGNTVTRFHRDTRKRKIFSMGKSLFVDACYIAVDDQYIHVSDTTKRCVVTLNRKGEALSTFKDGGCVKMLGLSTGLSGKVFVCRWPESLFMLTMSEHGCNIKKILNLDNVQVVSFDPQTLELWVSQATNNFINLYKFKKGQFS